VEERRFRLSKYRRKWVHEESSQERMLAEGGGLAIYLRD
jgi:hypothetical protein